MPGIEIIPLWFGYKFERFWKINYSIDAGKPGQTTQKAGLTGPAKRVVSFTQERSFSSQQEGRTEFNEDIGESRYRQSVWKTQKGKRV